MHPVDIRCVSAAPELCGGMRAVGVFASDSVSGLGTVHSLCVCDDLAALERSRKTRAELPKCWISSSPARFFKAANYHYYYYFFNEFHMLPENMLINALGFG